MKELKWRDSKSVKLIIAFYKTISSVYYLPVVTMFLLLSMLTEKTNPNIYFMLIVLTLISSIRLAKLKQSTEKKT